MKIDIVMPAYKEAENLAFLLPRIRSTLVEMNVDWRVIVVDSMHELDDTKSICAMNGVIYVNREFGDSYGDAIRTAIKYLECNYVLFMDSDGSHAPEFIRDMVNAIENNDLIVASRYIQNGSTDNTKILVFMSLIVNLIYSFFLNIPLKDISNSLKMYRSSCVKELDLRSDDFDIIEEIVYKLFIRYPDLKFVEIPFNFKERVHGTTKRNLFKFALSYVKTLIKLKSMH